MRAWVAEGKGPGAGGRVVVGWEMVVAWLGVVGLDWGWVGVDWAAGCGEGTGEEGLVVVEGRGEGDGGLGAQEGVGVAAWVAEGCRQGCV